ncbi:MAG TPA: group 1 glycosyl transferase [Gammaproteobacteria bacterium]|nr:group 1 glycosyl transferase [Gammaproteobacteria bacterium]
MGLVIPWFGRDLKGGAEQLAWQIATRLIARGHPVEVFTTCCRSFFDDWAKNHWPVGETHEAGLTIHRFPVKQDRNQPAFERLNAELLALPGTRLLPGVSPVAPEQAAVWTHQNINSPALETALAQRTDIQAFIFLPYLYGVILRGLPLVADRAWLQPCLHDEAYAYLPDVSRLFYQARGLLFNSVGEMQLAAQLYGPMVWSKGAIVGSGIELESLVVDHRANLPLALAERRFVLCLGRRDVGKGVDRLVAAFKAFRQAHPAAELRLALAGPGEGTYDDPTQGVIDLGLVSKAEKAALIQGCLALCQPSANESFSRVLFEAWICSKPAIVHRDCLATAMAVHAAQGGWIAGTEAEWATRLADLDAAESGTLAAIGAQSRDYAQDMADWERVMVRYERLLELPAVPQPAKSAKSAKSADSQPAIHQLLPNLSYGDAISNEARRIRDGLRAAGYRSEIWVRFIDPRLSDQCQRYTPCAIAPTDGLLYHHSIGSEITPVAVAHPGPKCLIYHNITPAEFFTAYRPEFATLLREGREALWTLAHSFPHSVGDSAYNAEELALYGFTDPGVLPLAIDPGQWQTPPDETLMRQLQDGQRNLLFVGRYAPNKCQHQLIEAFAHYLNLDDQARLILIGGSDLDDPYVGDVLSLIDALGLQDYIVLPGQITDAELQAYYQTAHLFWSMSEHEGFCVPLIEAMWFDIPILAFRSSAIPETLGPAGLMFDEKADLAQVAALAQRLATDAALRATVLEQQRHRRPDFLPKAVLPRLLDIASALSAPENPSP